MGTDETSTEKSDSFYITDPNDVSEFYNINKASTIDNASIKEEDSPIMDKKKELNSKTSESQNLIPTTFEWDNGGNNVYVTGSFCNWDQFFLMKKDSGKNFTFTLNLPKGYHQYKFKVDGEWKFNPKFPTNNDHGNINNYIDTKNLEIAIKNSDEGNTVISTSVTDNFNEKCKGSIKYSEIEGKGNSDLILTESLTQSKMTLDEQKFGKLEPVPIHYKYSMDINLLSNQNKLGNKKFMKLTENNILNDNLSFKKINSTPIEQINHLFIKNDFNETKPIICAISSRYRYKNTTFVYYKPK